MLCTVSVASNQISNVIGNHLEAVKHAYQLTPTAPQSPEMHKQTDKLTNNLLSASPDRCIHSTLLLLTYFPEKFR